MIWAGLILLWAVCGILTTGMTVANFQHSYPAMAKENYRQDLSFGIGLSLIAGPIALFIVFFLSGFAEHGLQYKRK